MVDFKAMTLRDPNCTRCKLSQDANFVCLIGEGPKPSKVMILGEAPGETEDEQGRPFVGRSGQLLRKVLKQNGIDDTEVYITNAVACRPPGNRTPKKNEIIACRYFVQKQFTRANPKFVLLLGNVPCQSALDIKGIKKLRGKPIERDGIIYLPTWHPAYVAREPSAMSSFNADIRYFKEIIDNGGIPREEGLNYEIVTDRADMEDMLKELYGLISYDIETTGLYPWAADGIINTFGFGTRDTQYIVPAQHKESKFSEESLLYMLDTLKARQEAGELRFVAQNGKFDMLWTWVKYGVRFDTDFDTMLAHYLLDENERHGLKELSKVYFGAPEYDIDEDTKFGRKGIKPLAYYQAHDLFYTRKLYFKLIKELKADPGVKAVFDNILMPCSNLFTEIEKRGVYLNLNQFSEAQSYLESERDKAESDLNAFVPKDMEMNWGSPKQVGNLLYNVFKIPITTKTKKGAPSTSETALNQIDHPLVEALIRCRGAKQQLSFFIEGWKPFLDGKRLHPSFKLHGTVTGRPSCEHPNLQQVPRDPRIRSLIGAPPGWELLEADLSQIELRIAAELSGEQEMARCFHSGIDVHWRTTMKSLTSDMGTYGSKVIETAKMFCVSVGLPANGSSTKILLNVLNANKNRAKSGELIQSCCEYWKNQNAGSRKWGQPGEREKRLLERWLSTVAKETSEEILPAMWSYTESLFASQRRESVESKEIQFGNALQVLSFIGPSIASELSEDWKEARKKAKAVGFGYLYGMWWKKFKIYARDNYGVNVTDQEAQQSRKDFFDLYKDFPTWHKGQRKFANKNGFVRSLSGRKRRLPSAQLPDDVPERREAERQAINSPVQSFASDLNLMTALQLRKEFGTDVLYIVGTVHDSILMEVRKEYVDKVYTRVLQIMSHPELLDIMEIDIGIPIEAEAKIGPWSKGISLEKWKANAKI